MLTGYELWGGRTMKIIIATAIGKNKSGEYFNLFPSRWSWTNRYHTSTFYPYELGYLSSLLKRDTDHHVKMIDGNYMGYTIRKYSDVLIEERPDVIVMEADSLTYTEDIEMLNRVKAAVPVRVILCGPYPSTYPQQALRDGADYVAIGEFEMSILELVKSGFDPETLGIYPNRRRPLLDVNTLPLPENDDIRRRDYCRLYVCEYREVEVFATRGCPSSCNFCVATNIYYEKPNFRMRNVRSVVDEIRYLKEDIPELEGIFFNEETHTANKKYTKELCDAIVEAGLDGLKYECMTNYFTLDEELLCAMKKAGYYKIRIGLETLDIENSDMIFSNKWKKDNDKLFEVLDVCRRLGIKVYVTVSVGTYGSTSKTDLDTLNSLKALYEAGLVHDFQVSINTPMPGTPFYDMVKEKGYLVSENPCKQNGSTSCVVSYPNYSKEEIERNFRLFQEFLEYVTRKNMENGVNYSMYDTEWVKKVLEITPISEQYT